MRGAAKLLVAAAVLAGLAGTASAQTRKALLVKYPQVGSAGGQIGWENGTKYVLGSLEQMGIQVDQVQLRQTKTEWLRLAQMPIDADFANGVRTGVQQYDMVILLGWRVAQGVFNVYGGVTEPDSLTRSGKWPVKPTVFLTCFGEPGPSIFQSSAQCSTGVTAGFSGAYPAGQTPNCMTAFIPGTDIEFGTNGNFVGVKLDYANNLSAHGATAQLRPLIGYHATPFRDPSNVADYDGPAATVNMVSPDTCIAWERDRSSIEAAPLVFCETSMFGSQIYTRVLQMAVARADSANGGVLTGSAPGWQPARYATVLSGVGWHTANDTFGDGYSNWGVLCSSARCESTTFKRMLIDSLGRILMARNAKLTIGFGTDSAAVYPNEVGWVNSLPSGTWEVFPQNQSGIYLTAGSVAGNVSSTHSGDTYGAVRGNRTWWSAAAGVPPYTPASNDTSIYANLYWQMNRAGQLFGYDKVAGFQYPCQTDYFPQGYTRAALPNPDTVGTCLAAAGIKVVGINIENRGASPGTTFTANFSGSIQTEITNKIWYGPMGRRKLHGWLQGMTDRRVWVKTAAQRGPEFEAVGTPTNYSHAHNMEFEDGNVAAAWYMPDTPFYYHNFHTFLDFLSVPAAQFTNASGNQTGGYYWVKYQINEAAAVNRYASKVVLQSVFADDL